MMKHLIFGVTLAFTLLVSVSAQGECNDITEGVVASSTNCAQYYDCGDDNKFHECPYPELFHATDKVCKHYELVYCGEKEEPIDPCDYVKNGCGHAQGHCIPCNIRYPSCKDKPDGDNAWEGKLDSPFYVTCKDGRIVEDGYCEAGIFDPELRKCVIPPQ